MQTLGGFNVGQQLQIFQVFYDLQTRAQLDPGFIPLNNSINSRPDWYEFWVILDFLRKNTLEDNSWYGFLSPKFSQKVGINALQLKGLLNAVENSCSVLFCSPSLDQLVYFDNVFEQGDFWHPGLRHLSEKILGRLGSSLCLSDLLSHSRNACFSNFIIAKPSFWLDWLQIAQQFWALAEEDTFVRDDLIAVTSYNNLAAQMKVFVQERLVACVMAKGQHKAMSIPLDFALREFNLETRELLYCMDILKQNYDATRDPLFFAAFKKLQSQLVFNKATLRVEKRSQQKLML